MVLAGDLTPRGAGAPFLRLSSSRHLGKILHMLRAGKREGRSAGFNERLRELGIRRGDLIEQFVRSSGSGGQKVNKTSTCVYLKHLPTGIEVKCQRERSQAMNRLAALELLAGKIAEAALRERLERRQEREKERRRKRPRPAALRERILEGKKKVAEKKKLRAKKFEE